MMKSIKIFSFVFLYSCSNVGLKTYFITSNGINVLCSDKVCFSQNEIQTTIDIVMKTLVEKNSIKFSFEKMNRLMVSSKRQYNLNIVEAKKGDCYKKFDKKTKCMGFKCNATTVGWCSGLTKVDGNNINMYVAKHTDCVAFSSLAHELIHFFEKLILNTTDAQHKIEPLWPNACHKYSNKKDRNECIKNTVLFISNQKICKKLCGDICNGKKKEK